MVSKSSWRYSFYKVYAAIFYHYFNERKPLTISRGNFFFETHKAFWLQKKKTIPEEDSAQNQQEIQKSYIKSHQK